ncbi:MAG: Ldh family oxidoreductase [Acidobacteria bacterium]|nr:Ldh family oxidoreductase [Acidobacteriota bacterium]
MADPVFSAESLRAYVQGLWTALGCRSEVAGLMAGSLVAAHVRGVDSHGLQLLPFYIAQAEDGRVDIQGTGRVASESGAVMVYDGENSLGQVVSAHCTDHAVRLAREHGLGCVVARESNHFGAAAWWAQRMSAHGMIGIVMCTASSVVAPWQGREPRWGTNPICCSVPGPDGGGWLLDMATTTVAMGKIYRANVLGKAEIPPGWAMDSEGVPTTSTQEALRGLLMPLGGYKGSGLALMVEMLCGVLSAGAISTELGGLRIKDRPFRVCQFFLALDVARFMPAGEFEERMAKLIGMVKGCPPAAGYGEVLVAGEPEWRTESVRLRDGVPVAAPLWESLVEIGNRLGVPAPEGIGTENN